MNVAAHGTVVLIGDLKPGAIAIIPDSGAGPMLTLAYRAQNASCALGVLHCHGVLPAFETVLPEHLSGLFALDISEMARVSPTRAGLLTMKSVSVASSRRSYLFGAMILRGEDTYIAFMQRRGFTTSLLVNALSGGRGDLSSSWHTAVVVTEWAIELLDSHSGEWQSLVHVDVSGGAV